MIQRLYDNCFAGVELAETLREQWFSLEAKIDERRYRHVVEWFNEHIAQTKVWRDTLVSLFYDHSGIPDEHGHVPLDD